jgi:hypothetical protein
MGELGVLVFTLLGGGVTAPLGNGSGLDIAAALVAVGLLNGRRFNGGSRSGRKFFFLTGVALALAFCSRSEFELVAGGACLNLFGSRSFRTCSRSEFLPDMLFVDVLLMLLVSKGMLVFRLAKNGGSDGESLGDS